MDPNFAAGIVLGLKKGDDGFDEAVDRMGRDNTVWDMASMYALQAVIRPQDTRDYLMRMLEVHRLRLTNGVGHHLMRVWPTTY